MEKILSIMQNYMKPFVPLKFFSVGSIAADENEFGDIKVLAETEDKIVTETYLRVSQRVVRRLYFKSCLTQVQCEVDVINSKDIKANLDEFKVYKCIIEIMRRDWANSDCLQSKEKEEDVNTKDKGTTHDNQQISKNSNKTDNKKTPNQKKKRSVLILGGGCSVLGDVIKENNLGVNLVKDVDIDREMFALGKKFFRNKENVRDKR